MSCKCSDGLSSFHRGHAFNRNYIKQTREVWGFWEHNAWAVESGMEAIRIETNRYTRVSP